MRGRYGRTWDRNRQGNDRLGATWGDFLPPLQGLLGGVCSGQDSLSATAFDSALGRIRDTLRGSEELRRVVVELLAELVDE